MFLKEQETLRINVGSSSTSQICSIISLSIINFDTIKHFSLEFIVVVFSNLFYS